MTSHIFIYFFVVALLATNSIADSPNDIEDLSAQDFLSLTIAQALQTNKVARQQSAIVLGYHVAAVIALIPNADPANIGDFIDAARMHLSEIIAMTVDGYKKWIPLAEESEKLILEKFTAEVQAADALDSPMMQSLLADLASTLKENIDATTELWPPARVTYEADLEDILDEVRRLSYVFDDQCEFEEKLRRLFEQSTQLLNTTMDGLHENTGWIIINEGKRSTAISELIQICIDNGYFWIVKNNFYGVWKSIKTVKKLKKYLVLYVMDLDVENMIILNK